MRWHARLLCTGLAVAGLLGPRASLAHALPRPRYELHAQLEPAQHRVRLRERITWHNSSRAPLDALVLHLYPNAFAGAQTVFMREGGASLRGQRLTRKGGIDLRSLSAGGANLLSTATRIGPPGDATQLRVRLKAALPPGGRIELEIEAVVRLPSIVARMGQAADFCMVAQFFPKVAKLEADGSFASSPYHGLGEFYADFADHDLTIEVPSGFTVVAPGRKLASSTTTTGTRIERYLLERALDIAFAASPDLACVTRVSGDVHLEACAPRGHARLASAQLELVARGLSDLGEALGPYPYERLVLLLPPVEARGAEGMEYPALIVSASTSALSELVTLGGIVHDVVTTHELAHQWFPVSLGTNEVKAPWLDEGIAQWLGTHLLRERYGARSIWARLLGFPLDPFELTRAALLAAREPPSSLLPASAYLPRHLAPSVYLRPALVLETISRTWGRARLLTALGAFTREHRFGHPGPDHFFRMLDRNYGPMFSATVVRPLLEGAAADVRIAVDTRHRYALRRSLGVALPVIVERRTADGRTRQVAVMAAQARLDIAPTADDDGVQLDPERANLADGARSDDQLRTRALAPEPSLLARLLVWAYAGLAVLGP